MTWLNSARSTRPNLGYIDLGEFRRGQLGQIQPNFDEANSKICQILAQVNSAEFRIALSRSNSAMIKM